MKKLHLIFLLSLLLSALVGLTGCQKHDINGDLDGLWQIMEIEQLGPSGEVQATITPAEGRYMSFQLHVCQLRNPDGPIGKQGTANMTFDGGTLTLDFPYATTEYDTERLTQWGIYTLQPVFTIETLDRSSLVMTSAHARLHCRRF